MSPQSSKQAAETIVAKLTQAGHQALLAGGCVRDLLLGQEPQDYDIATNARPEQICQLYPKAQKVGAHFGVVLVRQFGYSIEVATFRTDGVYHDGRHPEKVFYASAEEDARRRDFTINGMFLDPQTQKMIDHVGGQEDLRDRLIRAIGNPEQRFEEDHLRMLRAVRFAGCLNFHIEQETFEAIYNRAGKIALISRERIREELEKILCHPNRTLGFQLLCDTQLLLHLWPGGRWSTESIQKSRLALAALPHQISFETALVATLYHAAPREINKICRSLACSNQTRQNAVWLAHGLDKLKSAKVETLADLKLLMAGPKFDGLLQVYKSCLVAESLPIDPWTQLVHRVGLIPSDQIAPNPLITGNDLLALGWKEGPLFKRILDEVYYRQLNLEYTSREEAIAWAKKLAQDPGPINRPSP